MNKFKPVLYHQGFEARYDRGYRYLDRCGDVMLVLEYFLEAETGHIWMTDDMRPSGAMIKCPDLELVVQFDSGHLVITQFPITGEPKFAGLCEVTLATLIGRFDLRTFGWVGLRQLWWVGADSIEDAENLSLKAIPLNNWPITPPASLKAKIFEAATTFEAEDGSFGYRIGAVPAHKIGAQIKIDERLKVRSHTLPKGQRTVLIEQLKRSKTRSEDPEAGLQVDIDHYSVRPAKIDLKSFFQLVDESRAKLLDAVVKGLSK